VGEREDAALGDAPTRRFIGRRSRVRRVLTLAVFIVITVGAALYFLPPTIFYWLFVEPDLAQRASEDHKFLPRLLSDHAEISQTYLPVEFGSKEDAGPYLNPLVAWTGGEGRTPLAQLELPDPLLSMLKEGEKGAWIDRGNSIPWKQLDFTWMQRLSDFDYWDIHKSCVGCVSSEIERLGPSAYRAPAYKHLQGWAKLRLIKGVKEGDIKTGVKEVRDLARLVMSNETLASAMVAQGIYFMERAAFDYAKAHDMNLIGEWHPLDWDTLTKTKRACWATGTLFNLGRSGEAIRSIYDSKQPLYCKCAGMSEGMARGILVGSTLRHAAAPEHNKLMSTIIADAKGCRLTPLRSMWHRPNLDVSDDPESEINMNAALAALPHSYRKAIGGILIAVGALDSWKEY